MFNNLLESRSTTTKRTGGGVVSIMLHSAVVVALVVATANAGQGIAEDTPDRVDFIDVVKEELPPEREQAPPPDAVVSPLVAKGFQTLQAPDIIPIEIPKIDFSRAVTNAADFTGVGAPGGRGDGVTDGAPRRLSGDALFHEADVEKPAAMTEAPSMTYPEMLRSARVEGTVLASFVVDTTGYADLSTFTVISSDHELFTNAVQRALARIRYRRAEVGGRKVKQLVQQPFQFRLDR